MSARPPGETLDEHLEIIDAIGKRDPDLAESLEMIDEAGISLTMEERKKMTAADYLTEIPLFLEYKMNETRANCQLDTCAKTIVLLKEVQNAATGITIDFGHSLLARENSAQVLALCEQSGVDYYLHTNDNDWNHHYHYCFLIVRVLQGGWLNM